MKPGPKPKSPKSKWYVSFESKVRPPGQKRSQMRATEVFQTEQEAKAFARVKVAEDLIVNAGTLNPHVPKRTIASMQIVGWLNEPEGAIADGQSDNEAKGK
jgi:hypothetical protein